MEKPKKTPFLESKIWKILEIFQLENIKVEDHYVGLLFLTLWKSKILPVAYKGSGNEFYDDLKKVIMESESAISNQLLPTITSFESIIRKLSHTGLNEIIFEFNRLSPEIYSSNFSELFDYLLYRISDSQGRYGGEIIQPLELTKFLMSLADLPDNASVFNPFAGLASFGVFLEPNQQYFGQELNERTWAIGLLRMIAYDKTQSSRFKCEDSITNWPDQNQKFDLVISHPPFGLKLDKRLGYDFKKLEHLFLSNGIQSLTPDGKLIAILPSGLLYNNSLSKENEFRNYLVDNDLLDTIISLAGGVLSNTLITLSVIVLNRNKSNPNFFRFINADASSKKKNLQNKALDYSSLLQLVNSSEVDSKDVRIVSLEQIRQNDYNLNPPRYFKKEIEGVKLGSILELIKGKWSRNKSSGSLIKVKSLSDDKFNFDLKTNNVEVVELKGVHAKEINESCLLLATRWKNLKPTWFEYEDKSIFLGPGDILPFRINENIVDRAFLVRELHADYVIEQLNAYRIGSAIPYIRFTDLMEVVIQLPALGLQTSLDLQKAKIEGFKEEALLAKQKELGFDIKLNQYIEEQTRDFQSLKHTIRQYLSPLKSNVSGTRKFIQKNEGNPISLDMVYSKNLNQTLNQHLFSIEDIIDSINILLLSNEQKQLNGGSSDLIILIENCQRKFKQEDVFFFSEPEIDEESLTDTDENKIKPVIGLSEGQFETLFSNVIDNAVKHGFKEKKSGFMVKVFLGHDNGTIKMTISNNGKPLAEGFTKKHLTTLGEKTTDSAGTGTGGADIKKIVDLAGGAFDIISDPKADLFKVSYIFEFPLIIEE